MLNNPNYLATGNIYPSRFVETANAFRVRQAGANAPVCGISQPGTRRAPGAGLADADYAAMTGEPVDVIGPGRECLLELGGSVNAGDWLKADTDGKGVVIASSATTQNAGALARQGGESGELIRVYVALNFHQTA